MKTAALRAAVKIRDALLAFSGECFAQRVVTLKKEFKLLLRIRVKPTDILSNPELERVVLLFRCHLAHALVGLALNSTPYKRPLKT